MIRIPFYNSVLVFLPVKCQQIILGSRGQQVPDWRGVLPPNYSLWGFRNQLLVCDCGCRVQDSSPLPRGGGGLGLGGWAGGWVAELWPRPKTTPPPPHGVTEQWPDRGSAIRLGAATEGRLSCNVGPVHHSDAGIPIVRLIKWRSDVSVLNWPSTISKTMYPLTLLTDSQDRLTGHTPLQRAVHILTEHWGPKAVRLG